ncbi:hypothetical protein BABINDRAFT_162205 [Babjeviella inositovora NRRL Y-12698]|uniref:non-specific serine/threonine protein kinase n=1 Tax=Babjeviella inositovora NRRL Y-12698 TaxID=984486 RepID=A0A1E3QN66_9ASCO|nr:uncharacterized protein BABINDRAFT_162205 [Babjeviella inositovora NRRL Y-12698]ODQ79149.1 hypothetical protein BABINDRAFT_162205 [Babjeviella inositovora NRRL Y-12698]
MSRLSQLDALPRVKGLQFGRTIGQGSFAMVKVASETKRPSHVYAVKFIHRAYCNRMGITDDDIGREIMLHKKSLKHPNVISLLTYGTDNVWLWMAMELATGGDLFDKIEPDVGVDEQVANFYFHQLVNAVLFIHGQGIAHRDIKPENILLDARGNLKLADFGLGTVFQRTDGLKRVCHKPCGSPPYMAPEIVDPQGYHPELTDAWACGVVLYVLLSGQTPWDEPTQADPDFSQFLHHDGKLLTHPWNKFLPLALSIIRVTMRPNPEERYTTAKIKTHLWLKQPNPLADEQGLCRDHDLLTSKLLQNLHVDLNDAPTPGSQYQPISATQPINDIADMLDDEYDVPVAFTQQVVSAKEASRGRAVLSDQDEMIIELVLRDPATLQFSNTTSRANLELTERLTRFFSVWEMPVLVANLVAALNTLGIRFSDVGVVEQHVDTVFITVQCLDGRRMPMRGTIKLVRVENLPLRRVDFVKSKGDPLEWRRLFKRVVVLCRDAVYVLEGN